MYYFSVFIVIAQIGILIYTAYYNIQYSNKALKYWVMFPNFIFLWCGMFLSFLAKKEVLTKKTANIISFLLALVAVPLCIFFLNH